MCSPGHILPKRYILSYILPHLYTDSYLSYKLLLLLSKGLGSSGIVWGFLFFNPIKLTCINTSPHALPPQQSRRNLSIQSSLSLDVIAWSICIKPPVHISLFKRGWRRELASSVELQTDTNQWSDKNYGTRPDKQK